MATYSSVASRHQADHFQYPPLNLGKRAIRLIEVSPSDSAKNVVECRMKVVELGTEHIALSYVWGDDQPSTLIKIDGKPFLIRRNLAAFLRYASRYLANRLLWIDAICINQENVLERNHQVRQMIDIYKSAELVLTWLGPQEGAVGELCKIIGTSSNHDLRHRSKESNVFQNTYLANTIVQLCDVDYWSRLWIVPEVLSARRLCLASQDGYLLPWNRLIDFVHATCDWEYMQCITFKHVWQSVLDSKLASFSEIWQNSDTADYRFKPLLYAHGTNNCSDPRDRIFALLALSSDAADVRIDYNMSAEDLCVYMLSHIDAGDDDEAVTYAQFLLRILQIDFRKSPSIRHRIISGLNQSHSTGPRLTRATISRILAIVDIRHYQIDVDEEHIEKADWTFFVNFLRKDLCRGTELANLAESLIELLDLECRSGQSLTPYHSEMAWNLIRDLVCPSTQWIEENVLVIPRLVNMLPIDVKHIRSVERDYAEFAWSVFESCAFVATAKSQIALFETLGLSMNDQWTLRPNFFGFATKLFERSFDGRSDLMKTIRRAHKELKWLHFDESRACLDWQRPETLKNINIRFTDTNLRWHSTKASLPEKCLEMLPDMVLQHWISQLGIRTSILSQAIAAYVSSDECVESEVLKKSRDARFRLKIIRSRITQLREQRDSTLTYSNLNEIFKSIFAHRDSGDFKLAWMKNQLEDELKDPPTWNELLWNSAINVMTDETSEDQNDNTLPLNVIEVPNIDLMFVTVRSSRLGVVGSVKNHVILGKVRKSADSSTKPSFEPLNGLCELVVLPRASIYELSGTMAGLRSFFDLFEDACYL